MQKDLLRKSAGILDEHGCACAKCLIVPLSSYDDSAENDISHCSNGLIASAAHCSVAARRAE